MGLHNVEGKSIRTIHDPAPWGPYEWTAIYAEDRSEYWALANGKSVGAGRTEEEAIRSLFMADLAAA